MPSRSLRLLILLLVPVAPLAAQSAELAFTPYLGLLTPTADAARLGDGTTLRHKPSIAAGARVSLALWRRIGLELSAEYAPSAVRVHNDSPGQLERLEGFEETVDAHVVSGAARLSWAVLAPRRSLDLRVSGGLAIVDHGGPAYSSRMHRTRFGGVLGASAGVGLAGLMQLRLGIDDYVYGSDLTPIAFPLDRLDASAIPIQAPSDFRRTQHDVLISLGVTIR